MKNLLKSFIVAFSLYSKIPMPRFQWASKDMEFHLCFFPLVGAAIGGLEFLWIYISKVYSFSSALTHLFAISMPLLVTGGFHVDGFMDTMDAVHSYQDREKKLEILKDPHIGAFSVICVITYFLLAIGFSFEIKTMEAIVSICFSFSISRTLSGLSVILFPKAKKEGMVATESKTESKKIVALVLALELIALAAGLIYLTGEKSFCGIASLGCLMISFIYYYFMSKKTFGGITGDLAGFFICIGELLSLAGVAVCCILAV